MTASQSQATPSGSPRSQPIPPLENGDRLNRIEFERRYSAISDVKKAELVEGKVDMASPLHFEPLKLSQP